MQKKPAEETTEIQCGDCGMIVTVTEYHPFAACLMYKTCHDSGIVRVNLINVVQYGIQSAFKTMGILVGSVLKTKEDGGG